MRGGAVRFCDKAPVGGRDGQWVEFWAPGGMMAYQREI